MNRAHMYTLAGGSACLVGILTWCIMHEWIIIQIPKSSAIIEQKLLAPKETKPIKLFFWHNHRWHTETDMLVWSPNMNELIKTVLCRWLNILHEEQCIPTNISLQSVLMSNDSTIAFVSFTTNPLNSNAPTLDNILFIKGLLHTLNENNIPIHAVAFMENHKPLEHTQLDFARPWPLHSLDHINPNY